MAVVFESRNAAALELYPTIPLERGALVVVLSEGAVAVAYPLVVRRGCELRELRCLREVDGRDVWLIDDGEADSATLQAALRRIRSGSPRSLRLAAPVLPRRVIEGCTIDGFAKIYWTDAVDPALPLYRRQVSDASFLLRSAAASRIWDDRIRYPKRVSARTESLVRG